MSDPPDQEQIRMLYIAALRSRAGIYHTLGLCDQSILDYRKALNVLVREQDTVMRGSLCRPGYCFDGEQIAIQ